MTLEEKQNCINSIEEKLNFARDKSEQLLKCISFCDHDDILVVSDHIHEMDKLSNYIDELIVIKTVLSNSLC